MIVATIIGTMLAIGLVRARTRWSPAANVLMLIPLVTPEIVAGISALLIFSQLGIQLSFWTVVIAHITFSISYVTIVVRGRLATMGDEVEQAAMDLGATRWQSVRLVLVPNLWPAIVAAGLLVFALSFDDFVLSFFTTGEDAQPLPVRIWSAIRFGVSPTINAIGTLMMAVSLDRGRGGGADPAPVRAQGERNQGPDWTGRWLRCSKANGNGEAIRLEGVSKRFGEFTAVDDIDVSIGKGEFFSLLGPSGCGKTTTLRMLAGFEVPTEGRILLEGEPVEDVPPYKRNVNMVFQSYALFDHLDLAGNVAFGPKRRGVPKDEIATRVNEALTLVGLEDRAKARPGELSGGQRQRVALARALVNKPSVLLLDEPLGALDLKLRRQMQVELKQIQREVGITFVYVTHDQEEALSMSDRIAVMSAGRIAQCGVPEDVYEHPTEEFVAGFIGISNLLEGVVESDQLVRVGGDMRIAAPVPSECSRGDVVQLSVRPEKIAVDEDVEDGMVRMRGTVIARVYHGVNTQITVELGGGSQLVALEQATYRASADDRWEEGMEVTLGWHPENTLVLR